MDNVLMFDYESILNNWMDDTSAIKTPKTESEIAAIEAKREWTKEHTTVWEIRSVNGLRTFVKVRELHTDDKETTRRVFAISTFSLANDGKKLNGIYNRLPALTIVNGQFEPCKAKGSFGISVTQENYNRASAIVTKANKLGWGIDASKIEKLLLTLQPAF